ncbi:MAG: CD225/dispanin family protein [Weeksellaceae bacterium]|nr:CD225/dispanin family protein [Weeksellaceae bacterium]
MNEFSNHNYQDASHFANRPDNYRTLTIVGTIMGCCSPLLIGFVTGVVSLYFSTQVDSRYNAGDQFAAEKNSKNARLLAFISIGLGVAGLLYSYYVFSTNPEMMEQIRQAIEEAQAGN